MKMLSNLESIERLDPAHMRRLLEGFGHQLVEASAIGESLKVNRALAEGVRSIVFSGLGGSAIGADVIKGYLEDEIALPLMVNRSYTVPRFVGPGTLFIASSYSGQTEETVSAYRQAKERGAACVAISSGGRIEKMAREYGDFYIKIPSGYPPRAALGFSVMPLLWFLDKLGLARFSKPDLEESLGILETQRRSFAPDAPDPNQAKELALVFHRRYPLFYSAASHFEAVALRWRGQMAENAKSLSSHHVLPEMNHNEIVGWHHPEEMMGQFAPVLLRDSGEHPRVRIRMGITKKLIEEKGAKVTEAWSQGKSLLARIFSLIYLGDFASFYLAILYEVDPTAVKVIDYLKGELAKV